MDNFPVPPQKKGLSGLAWLGIGCGGVVVIFVTIGVLGSVFLGPTLKKFADDTVKDPTRATTMMTVKMTMGQMELVKEDEANKRYTLREKSSGKLMTIFWNAQKHAVDKVEGDFSAIPADANPPATPAAK